VKDEILHFWFLTNKLLTEFVTLCSQWWHSFWVLIFARVFGF